MKNWPIELIVLIAISLMGHETSYAGENWKLVSTAKYTLNNKQDAIAFADDKNGWYGNGTGTVYKTSDGGRKWKAIWFRRGTYIRALEFADDKLGFLGNVGPGYFPNVSDSQPLYLTRDGGTHWEPVRPTSGRQIVGVCAIDVLRIEGRIAAIRAGGRVGRHARIFRRRTNFSRSRHE